MGKRSSVYSVAQIGLTASLLAVCAYISIPFGVVPVTLQTFILYVAMGVFGTKKSCLSVFVYLLLGFVGLPVFSHFQNGLGVLMGATGGYLIGFLPLTFVSGFIIKKTGKKFFWLIAAFLLGTVVCYIFGSVWYMAFYLKNVTVDVLRGVMTACVLPFVLPDILKSLMAAIVTRSVLERSRNEYY